MKLFKHQKCTLSIICISLLTLFISCEKDAQPKKGYTLITTITNTLPVSVEIRFAGWIRNKIKIDSLKYLPSIYLKPGESLRTGSAFICLKNCESVFNESDPYTGIPILVKFIIDNKVKVDTNCANGLISSFSDRYSACVLDKKNYFNSKHHVRTEVKEKNIVQEDYQIDTIDLSEAK